VGTLAVALFTWTLYRATTDTLRLAREEFISTHRPKIVVRAVEITDREISADKPVGYTFIAQNAGEARARIIEVAGGIYVGNKRDNLLPPRVALRHRESISDTLLGGQRKEYKISDPAHLTKGDSMAIWAGDKPLYCVGTVFYSDDAGVNRETGFCRMFHPRDNRWTVMTGSEYEYEY